MRRKIHHLRRRRGGAASRPRPPSWPSACEALGLGVVVSREPGGSAGAEAIRHVLLSGAAKPLGPHAEAILFAAARADHLRQTIRPALERGAMGDQRPLRGFDPHLSGRARQRRCAADRAAGEAHRRRARARPHHHPRRRRPRSGLRAPPSGAATRRSTGSRARRSISTRSCARPIWSSPSASRSAAS